MATSTQQTVDKLVRQVQEGLDNTIDHIDKFYKGVYRDIFEVSNHDKYYYEFMQQSGAGLAAQRGEGAEYTQFDSLDQDFVEIKKLITYEKAFKVTLEAQRFNLYQDLPSRLVKEGQKAHEGRRDWDAANLLNNGFDATNFAGPDGQALFDDAHTITGSTTTIDNRIDQDFDQDALEQMEILVDKFRGADGLYGDYNAKMLVYPPDLQHEVKRVLGSTYEPASANNAINPMADSVRPIKWKRLTDTDAFFLITDAPNGLMCKENMPITASDRPDPFSPDKIIALISIYRCLWEDWRLGVGSPGV